jgi:hypothetical protein
VITAVQKEEFVYKFTKAIVHEEGKELNIHIEGDANDKVIFSQNFYYAKANIFQILLDVIDYLDDEITSDTTSIEGNVSVEVV